MKQGFKRAVGALLSVCMIFSFLPVSPTAFHTVMAANNGTLQNGALSQNADGWVIDEMNGTEVSGKKSPVAQVDADKGCLDVYGGDEGTNADGSEFKMSQTVQNMKAGSYVAGIVMVGQGNNLIMTVKNETTGNQKSVTLTPTGWNDNWKTEGIFSTESLAVAEGDDVTITISGTVNEGNWYNIVDVTLNAQDDAAEGTLVNGALKPTKGEEEGVWTFAGWTITGDYGYNGNDGDLNLSDSSKSGTILVSQTVENMEAGSYVAGVAMTAGANQNNLEMTVKNERTGETQSVTLTPTGWDNGWSDTTDASLEARSIFSTQALEVAKGDSVTISISGTIGQGQWYRIRNVSLKAGKEDTAVPAGITVKKVDGLSEDFIHGMDLSMYLSEVQSGVKYYDEKGNEKNLFDILSDAGVNYVRLRIWNCPYAVDYNGHWRYVNDAEPGQETEYYTADQGKDENGHNKVNTEVTEYTTGEGETYYYKDENGVEHEAGTLKIKPSKVFASPDDGKEYSDYEWAEYFIGETQVYPEAFGAGNCGLDTIKTIGKIATDHGMKVLIDYHYSDFWADPNKWSVPRVWGNKNLDEKAEALYAYTKDSLSELLDAGVDVGMVQIGNEINNGLAGEKQNPHKLLRAGSKAVREVSQEKGKDVLIAVHYTDPHTSEFQMGKAQALEDNEVDYDVFATSYYPFWHEKPQNLTANLKKLADTYHKKVMVTEISWPWTYDDGDNYPNMIQEGKADQTFDYPVSVEGQATVIRDTIAAVSAIGPSGIGTFYWEPAWIPVPVENQESLTEEQVKIERMKKWRKYGSGWASIYAAEVDPEVVDDENGGNWDNQAYFDFNGKALESLNVYKYVYTGSIAPTSVGMIDVAEYEMDYKRTPNLPKNVTVHLSDDRTISVPVTWDANQVEALKTASFGEYRVTGKTNAFTYEDTNTNGEDVTKEAGAYKATCVVTIAGVDYVTNGSFEKNDGTNANGWTCTKLNDISADKMSFHIGGPNSANAKFGLHYYDLWAEANSKGIDVALEQEISRNLPAGEYTLQAWYMGVRVDSSKGSTLYAVVTDKNGKQTTYTSEDVKINNTWKDFYQGTLNFPVAADTQSVKIGTRVVCTSSTGEGAWVTVDGVSLMRQGDIQVSGPTQPDQPQQPVAYKVTYDVNGGQSLSGTSKTITAGNKCGTLPSPVRTGYTFAGWFTAKTGGTSVSADSTISADTTIYARWTKVTVAKAKKPTVKKASKTSMKVSFKKVKDAQGYRITYSTSKKFTKKTTKSVTTTKLKTTIKKLKKNKTYYVKVQAYKKDSANKNVYGKYSAVKSIKLK